MNDEGTARRSGTRLATAALVLGLCSLIPFLGVFCAIAAVVLAFMALARKGLGRNRAVGGLVIALVGVLESAGLMFMIVRQLGYPFDRTTDPRVRVMCGSNLNRLGMNVALYMADNDGVPPPSVRALVNSQGMSPAELECPSAQTPGRPSIFVLFPKTGDVPVTTLMACDYRGNHAEGRNVLTFNGMVRYVKTEAAFQAELAKAENAAFAAALRAREGP